jgi:hypothetical protein
MTRLLALWYLRPWPGLRVPPQAARTAGPAKNADVPTNQCAKRTATAAAKRMTAQGSGVIVLLSPTRPHAKPGSTASVSSAGISGFWGLARAGMGARMASSRRDDLALALDRAPVGAAAVCDAGCRRPGPAGGNDDDGGPWRSGREWHAAQPVQREEELVRPGPAGGQVQVPASGGAGQPAGQVQVADP